MQNRVDTVIKYLRTLVPLFKPVYFDETFGSIISSLETEIRRKTSNESTNRESPERTALFELKINQNIFEKVPEEDEEYSPPQRSRIICDKTPPLPVQPTKPPAPVSTGRTNSKHKKLLGSKVTASKRDSSSDDIVILDSILPPTKKARVEAPTPSSDMKSSTNKPAPRNAFAILMGRSREIAEQNRIRKLAREQGMQ